jgi:hypothetical protein
VTYDRIDKSAISPFPDDYFLVDDPSTPSGKRIQAAPLIELGTAIATQVARSVANSIGDRDGFSPIQPLLVDFSESVDAARLPADEFASLDALAPIGIYDLDPASPGFGSRVPFVIRVRTDAARDGTFDHSAVLFPAARFEPGGTYALVVTRRLHVTGERGRPFDSSDFFRAVAEAPVAGEAAETARARESIEPVLVFLESVPQVPIPREDVALAVRFSIRSEALDPSDLIAIKEAVLAAPPPVLNVTSIETPGYRAAILRGTVDLPSYIDLQDFRNLSVINRDPVTGDPVPVGVASVPFVLSLPHQSLAGPVPVVFFQHGSPGSPEEVLFEDFLDDAGYAIAGIQDVRNRRFGQDPGAQLNAELNHVVRFRRLPLLDFQTQADMLGFLRAIHALGSQSWLPVTAPDPIPEIDPAKILFEGISWGSMLSMAFLPLAPEVTAAASLVGGGRRFEFTLHQTDAASLDDFMDAILGIRPGQVLWGLAAIQGDYDRQDAQLLARHLYREPLAVAGQEDNTPPSLLLVEGIGDSLSTATEMRGAANELGIPLVRPLQQSTPTLEEVDAPVAENIASDVTAGLFQYDPIHTPSCRDVFQEFEGHFCPQVAFEAEDQILHFFSTALDPVSPPEIIDPF